jgi:hypothetical protein
MLDCVNEKPMITSKSVMLKLVISKPDKLVDTSMREECSF